MRPPSQVVDQWRRILRALLLRSTVRDLHNRAHLAWEYTADDGNFREMMRRCKREGFR